ncbi:MAG TPA: MlaD family protein [Acidobacteriota bacterium]|nr:MlaD family protein [Acidobacteriota bacterium]HNJ43729.1 MlaD family protein [Acidobacteriota bacterium]
MSDIEFPSSHAESRSFRRGLVMTALGVLVLIIGVFSLVKVLDSGVRLYTQYHSVDGLHTGAEVRLAGVKIGKVKSFRFLDTTDVGPDTPQVEVEMLLDPTFQGKDLTSLIYKDSVVYLRTEGSLAQRILDIADGTPRSGTVKDGDLLKGQIDANLQRLSERGQTLTQTLEVAQTQLNEVGKNLKAGRGSVGAFLYRKEFQNRMLQLNQEVDSFVRELDTGPGNIRKLRSPEFRKRLDRLSSLILKIADQVVAGKGTLGKAYQDQELANRLTRMAETYQRLGQLVDKLNQRYKAGNGSIGKLAHDPKFQQDVRELQARIKRLSDGVKAGEGTIGKYLQDPRLKNSLADTTTEAFKTLYDIQQSPRRYIRLRFSLF